MCAQGAMGATADDAGAIQTNRQQRRQAAWALGLALTLAGAAPGVATAQTSARGQVVHSGTAPTRGAATATSADASAAAIATLTASVPKEPVDPTAQPIAIGDALHLALSTAPKLRQAEAQRDSQTETRRSAWADVGPRVSADYSAVRFSDPLSAAFPGSPATATTPATPPTVFLLRPQLNRSASITVMQPITGAYALIEKARYEGIQSELKEKSLQLTRSDVAYEAIDLWLKAYAAQRQLEILEAEVQAAQGQARDGEAMEHAGRLNHADTLKLQLQVSEAKSSVAQARAVRDTVLAALHESLGLAVGAPIALQGELPQLAPPPTSAAAAVKLAMAQRLEPKQAENGVQAAEFGKKIAYARYTPNVNVFAKSEEVIGPVPFGTEKFTHSYGVQASWDLWANGSTTFALRAAGQDVIAAEEAQHGVEQMIRLDVQQALANYMAAQETLVSAKQAVEQADEAYRIELVRFRTGTVLISDLLLVQTSQTAAKGRLVAAQTDAVAWNFKTQKALGLPQPQL